MFLKVSESCSLNRQSSVERAVFLLPLSWPFLLCQVQVCVSWSKGRDAQVNAWGCDRVVYTKSSHTTHMLIHVLCALRESPVWSAWYGHSRPRDVQGQSPNNNSSCELKGCFPSAIVSRTSSERPLFLIVLHGVMSLCKNGKPLSVYCRSLPPA